MLFLFLCFLFAFYALYYSILFVSLMLFLLYSRGFFCRHKMRWQNTFHACAERAQVRRSVWQFDESDRLLRRQFRSCAFSSRRPLRWPLRPLNLQQVQAGLQEIDVDIESIGFNLISSWINSIRFDPFIRSVSISSFIAPGGSKADARRRNVKEKKSNLEEVTAFFEFSFCLLLRLLLFLWITNCLSNSISIASTTWININQPHQHWYCSYYHISSSSYATILTYRMNESGPDMFTFPCRKVCILSTNQEAKAIATICWKNFGQEYVLWWKRTICHG